MSFGGVSLDLVGQKPTPPVEPIGYTVVTPAVFYVNSRQKVIVTVSQCSYPVHVELEIVDARDFPIPRVTLLSANQIVSPDESAEVVLEIGDWRPGQYKFAAKGYKTKEQQVFQDEATIEVKSQSDNVILIQTDKPMYKAGQDVKFRVLAVNSKLCPLSNQLIAIHIKDGKNNMIKQWTDVPTGDYGVVSEEFQLSEEPVLGQWSINVELGDHKASKTFSVDEYVLPLFDAELKTDPSYITLDKSEFILSVSANYTYGKPLDGKATIKIRPQGPRIPATMNGLEQVHQLTGGKIDIPFNPINDLDLNPIVFHKEYDNYNHLDAVEGKIEIDVTVEDQVSGTKQNRTHSIPVYDRDIKLELIKPQKRIKPGLKFPVLVKIAYQDDTPVDDKESELSLYSYVGNNLNEILRIKPQNGIAKADIIVKGEAPYFHHSIVNLRAKYKSLWYILGSIDPEISLHNAYLQLLSRSGDRIKVGDKIHLVAGIRQNEPETMSGSKSRLIVLLLNEEKSIVDMKSFDVDSGSSSCEFSIDATELMAPKVNILVYHELANEAIIADALELTVDSQLKTPVNVSTSPSTVQPEESVEVVVKTLPQTFLGFLAVDQSVLLLGGDNDLSMKGIQEEIKRSKVPQDRRRSSGLYGCFWNRPEVNYFEDSGLILMSRSLKRKELEFESDSLPVHMPMARGMRMAEGAVLFGATQSLMQQCGAPAPAPLMFTKKRAMPQELAVEEPILFDIEKQPEIKVRKNFPETWIWESIISNENGSASISKIVPDTMTSWFINAFGMHPQFGLGLAESRAKVTVFRPFFLKLNLPYSVIRGETIAIPVMVYNYQSFDIHATIDFENYLHEFEFMPITQQNEVKFGDSKGRERRAWIRVAKNGAVTVPFMIRPIKTGRITLKVNGMIENGGDSVEKKLLIKPEGVTQYFNQQLFIELNESEKNEFEAKIPITLPDDRIPDSELVSVSAIGLLLGAALSNVENLVRMPYGCGEQNMVGFVPNILVLDYLQRINQLTPKIKAKAINHLESGYQRQLRYMHSDGSFSVFGESDKSGSMWLTAYVVKSFLQAAPHINIDRSIVSKSMDWIVKRQQIDGSFEDEGYMYDPGMTGASTKSKPSMTAFVLIALLQDKEFVESNAGIIKRSLMFLTLSLGSNLSSYELAIVNYALHLANSESKDNAFSLLEAWAIIPDGVPLTDSTSTSSTAKLPITPLEIEATSYVLLTLVLRNEIPLAMTFFKWLISKQNSKGGFMSTQDTVIGLQAMASLAGRLSTDSTSIEISFTPDHPASDIPRITIDSSNRLLLQTAQLSKSTRSISVQASGAGLCIAQVSWQYDVIESKKEIDSFFVKPSVIDSNERQITLQVNSSYSKGKESGMAVMEIELPSGFMADVERIENDSNGTKSAKRVEFKNSETKINLYFDKMTMDETQITVYGTRVHEVGDLKPVPIMLYDYYDPVQKTTVYYELEALKASA